MMSGVYQKEKRTFTPVIIERCMPSTSYSLQDAIRNSTNHLDLLKRDDHIELNPSALVNNSADNMTRSDDSLQANCPPQHDQSDTSQDSEEPRPASIFFFSSNSTFHGLSHFVQPGKITLRKILWGIAFFTSLFGLLTQGYDRYSYYMSNPHVTKLDEEEAAELVFPVLTICNMNRFRRSQITTRDYYYLGSPLFNLFDSNYNLKNSFRDNKTWPEIKAKIADILEQGSDYRPTQGFDMKKFYVRTGHDLDGIVKQCKYRGKKCRPEWWVLTFTRYGKCYTFNSGKATNGQKIDLLRTPKGGVDNGLELLLDTEQDEYMPVWAETDEISIEAGFKVQIHAQTEPPFIHELGFGIAPGFQTLVATQEQRITFLPKPYGECESGKNKNKFKFYDNYSISACRISCETEHVMKKCQCRMIHMPGSGPYCSPEEYKSCADPQLDYLVNLDEKVCVCGTPCEVIRYNLEMSTLQLPSSQAVSYLAAKYGKTEEYTSMLNKLANYATCRVKFYILLGDIGGQMGLFIGASILTILELFDYVYEVIKDKTWGRKQRKERNKRFTQEIKKNDAPDIDGKQELDHNHTQPYEARLSDKRPFTSYSHLSPLPEYNKVRKRQLEPQYVTSTLELDNKPNSLLLGNSYASHRDENNRREKQESSFFYSPTTFQHPSSDRSREISMSYNDLYRPPASSWTTNEHASNLPKPPLSFNPVGYTLPLSPMTTGRQSRPNDGFFLDVDTRRQLSNAHLASPTANVPSVHLDFPLSKKETEIN